MAEIQQEITFASVVGRWFRDSWRVRGAWGSLKYLAGQCWEVVKDSTPERRRSRFGDIDYDCDYGVNTTWARLPWKVRLREIFAERLYQPTMPDEFNDIMMHLATVDFSGFTFVDMGSGKGRVLLMAAMYPFAHIIGVEVQPELCRISEANVAQFDAPGQQCKSIESYCMDAREFDFPESPLVVYLFNPFPDYVLESVLNRLAASIRNCPRPVYLLYNAPFEHHVMDDRRWLERVVDNPRFQIYRVLTECLEVIEMPQKSNDSPDRTVPNS